MEQTVAPRRLQACLSQFGTTTLHLRNPWVVAFWSFAFPGCGHLMQGRLLKGFVLILWELVINTNAKINLAIMHSLLGHFTLAKQVINTRWFLVYIGLYVFAIWDSYRGTVDINKHYVLAAREHAQLQTFVIDTFDINALDKRSPVLSAVWSLLSPGLGHLYVHKVLTGIYFIVFTITVMYCSHGVEAVHAALDGRLHQMTSILNMQWLMYLPSIYGFVIHDSCTLAVEYNKLLEREQRKLLRDRYQRIMFKMPL